MIETHQLLERISALLRSEQRAALNQHGLQPIQLEALHYLSQANRYSNTPIAVTEFLGQTKGTVSQTIKVLEKKGLLEKSLDMQDKRLVHLQLTAVGQSILRACIPPQLLSSAVDQLNTKDAHQLNTALKTLLSQMQKAHGSKTFGVCNSCIHHLRKPNGHVFCGLTQERLLKKEHAQICREHTAVV